LNPQSAKMVRFCPAVRDFKCKGKLTTVEKERGSWGKAG